MKNPNKPKKSSPRRVAMARATAHYMRAFNVSKDEAKLLMKEAERKLLAGKK